MKREAYPSFGPHFVLSLFSSMKGDNQLLCHRSIYSPSLTLHMGRIIQSTVYIPFQTTQMRMKNSVFKKRHFSLFLQLRSEGGRAARYIWNKLRIHIIAYNIYLYI